MQNPEWVAGTTVTLEKPARSRAHVCSRGAEHLWQELVESSVEGIEEFKIERIEDSPTRALVADVDACERRHRARDHLAGRRGADGHCPFMPRGE